MDSIDYKILQYLQKNGRISIKALAAHVSLTPPAVSERIKKMESSGIITGYRAVIDPKKLGFNIRVIINITIGSDRRKDFLDFARRNPNISKCHHVTGAFSMCIEAIFKDMADLELMIGKIQQYGNTQTLIVMSSPIQSENINLLIHHPDNLAK